MNKLTSLSIFFPAYNDANTIPDLVNKARRSAEQISNIYEIIVVDDGSTDGIKRIATSLNVRFVSHKKNRGYGAALRTGFRMARYDWVFYTDGDGQYDPSELSRLVARRSRDTDVVNGYKMKRSDPWYRTLIGTLYNAYTQVRFHPPIRDVDCDFRLIRRSLLQHIRLTSTSGTICVELITQLQKAGARFAEVPVHHYPRPFGHSQFFQIPHLVTTIRELWNQPKE